MLSFAMFMSYHWTIRKNFLPICGRSYWEVERVGRHDNFFELGGHSLLAVQLIERLRRLNLYLEMRSLFATPVLRELAAASGPAS